MFRKGNIKGLSLLKGWREGMKVATDNRFTVLSYEQKKVVLFSDFSLSLQATSDDYDFDANLVLMKLYVLCCLHVYHNPFCLLAFWPRSSSFPPPTLPPPLLPPLPPPLSSSSSSPSSPVHIRYQFHPTKASSNVACQILLKALTNLPTTDVIMLKAVLPTSLVS